MKLKLKKGDYVTVEQLINCGWKFKKRQGIWEVWEQAKEELYYERSEGAVVGVFQKGGLNDTC